MDPFSFSRMILLGVTAIVALTLLTPVTEPAAAIEATVVKTGATPQLATRADHPTAYKKAKKKQRKKKK